MYQIPFEHVPLGVVSVAIPTADERSDDGMIAFGFPASSEQALKLSVKPFKFFPSHREVLYREAPPAFASNGGGRRIEQQLKGGSSVPLGS